MWAGIAPSVMLLAKGGRSGDRNPMGAGFSAPVQTGPGAYPASYKMDTGPLSRGESGRGVTLATHTHLEPRVKAE